MPKKVSDEFIQQRSKCDLLNWTAEDVCPLSLTPISELIEEKDAVMIVIPEEPEAIGCIYSRESLKQWLCANNPRLRLFDAHALSEWEYFEDDLKEKYTMFSLISVIMFVLADGFRSLITNDEMLGRRMYFSLFLTMVFLTMMDTYLSASRVKKTLLAPFLPSSQARTESHIESWLGENTVAISEETVAISGIIVAEIAKESSSDQARGKLKLN
jgi:hypothetical protein